MKNIATGKEVCSIFIFGSWEVSSMASGDESEPTTFRALLDLGKSLDLTGKELHEFAVKQQNLARKERQRERDEKDKEREERKQEREANERKEAREANERKEAREERERKEAREANERQQEREKEEREREKHAVREHEIELARLEMEKHAIRPSGLIDEKETGQAVRSPPKIDIPKFENRYLSDVSKYLDLFVIVVKQNQYEEAVWPLALRTAVIGTKLESIVSPGGTYQEIKKEVLLAHGQTADKLWRQLVTTTQGSRSFRQWCIRASDKLLQFFQLAIPTSSSDDGHSESELCGDFTTRPSKSKVPVDIVLEILQKFLIFEGCSKDLKAHFLERKFTQMSFDEFQELGAAFQQAHDRKSTDRVNMPDSADCDHDENHSSSTQAWKVSVHDTVASLKKMPLVKDRHEFVRRKQLCLNCLMPHHLAVDCVSKIRCSICKGQHHYLLHFPARSETQAKQASKQETKVKMVSCLNSSNVLLMTAAVDVVSSSGVRRKVRAFIDQGSQLQASFVTSDLVSSLEAPQIREVNLSIQGFSGKTDTAQTSVHELRVIDCSGTYHVLNVIAESFESGYSYHFG